MSEERNRQPGTTAFCGGIADLGLVMCTYMYAFIICVGGAECPGRGGGFSLLLLLSLLMWFALNHYRCLVLHMIELYLFFCFVFFTPFSLAFLIGGGEWDIKKNLGVMEIEFFFSFLLE